MATSVIFPGQFAGTGANPGYNYGPDANFPPVYLTGARLSANAAAFPTLTFTAYNSLEIRLHIVGFSGTDIASLRFNSDSGNNYWDRNITIAAGGVVVVDNPTVSTSQMRVGITGTTQIVAVVNVINLAGSSKLAVSRVAQATGAAGTAGTGYVFSGGEWVNTTAQISTLNVQCVGANSFLSGSTVQIYGGL